MFFILLKHEIVERKPLAFLCLPHEAMIILYIGYLHNPSDNMYVLMESTWYKREYAYVNYMVPSFSIGRVVSKQWKEFFSFPLHYLPKNSRANEHRGSKVWTSLDAENLRYHMLELTNEFEL